MMSVAILQILSSAYLGCFTIIHVMLDEAFSAHALPSKLHEIVTRLCDMNKFNSFYSFKDFWKMLI